MQTIQEPDVLQQPFCESGDKNTIPSAATGSQLASLAEGFPEVTQKPTVQGGIPPERKDFNGAFNLLSQYNYAIQNGWLPTFKTDVSNAIGGYAEGACLWYMPTSGTYAGQVLMLKSLVANNTYDFTSNPDGYIGTYWKIVTSAGGNGGLPLLSFLWADHLLNNASYLRADTFSWQSGSVYTSAYAHLVADISGITSETETIAGTTITFKRATDGHKIVDDTQVSNVEAIYNATGVAWYYVLDTTNQRFKLPRSKWNFVGLRDNVGNYVPESLPNITGTVGSFVANYTATGAFEQTAGSNTGQGGGGQVRVASFDASRSSSTYQNSAPVQPRATQAYLYFYVGNTVQNQTEIDVGQLTEEINDRADSDLSNVPSSKGILVESYVNGTSWYRVYSDGWCEQGGSATVGTNYVPDANNTITLLKTYANTDYTVVIGGKDNRTTATREPGAKVINGSSFAILTGDDAIYFYWVTQGYLS